LIFDYYIGLANYYPRDFSKDFCELFCKNFVMLKELGVPNVWSYDNLLLGVLIKRDF